MIRLFLLLLAFPAGAAELTGSFGPEEAETTLTVRSTTDLEVLGPVIEGWLETRPDTRVTYEQWGSNDLYDLTRAECGSAPTADLVISSAVHHMVELVNVECAETHVSPRTSALPAALRWRDQLWGISREPAVIVYNRDLLAPWEVPRSRFDLLDLLRTNEGRFEGRVATYDVEASGLGFLLAFWDAQEATTFGSLLEAFDRSGAVATCCSAEIIDRVASGDYLVAYNVLGSYALLRAADTPALGVVAPEDYTLTLSRAAMIPAGALKGDTAGDLLDYLLSPEGRARLQARHLIVDLGPDDAGPVEAGAEEGAERRIPLSPSLLVARDAHKVRLFTERWRATFAGGD